MPDRQLTSERKREMERMSVLELPRLLQKPVSKWTKAEIWTAIELYILRPHDGLVNRSLYSVLELKLHKCDLMGSKKRGRPKRFTAEVYRSQWESVQRLRHKMATEEGVAIEKVTYKQVARRMAERVFKNYEPNAPDFKIRELTDRFAVHYKALNKKKKSGEI